VQTLLLRRRWLYGEGACGGDVARDGGAVSAMRAALKGRGEEGDDEEGGARRRGVTERCLSGASECGGAPHGAHRASCVTGGLPEATLRFPGVCFLRVLLLTVLRPCGAVGRGSSLGFLKGAAS